MKSDENDFLSNFDGGIGSNVYLIAWIWNGEGERERERGSVENGCSYCLPCTVCNGPLCNNETAVNVNRAIIACVRPGYAVS